MKCQSILVFLSGLLLLLVLCQNTVHGSTNVWQRKPAPTPPPTNAETGFSIPIWIWTVLALISYVVAVEALLLLIVGTIVPRKRGR